VANDFRLDDSPLSHEQLSEAAQVAKRAFFDDQYFRFLMPNDRARDRSAAILFFEQLRHLGRGGRVVTVRDGRGAIVAVAGWLMTDQFPPPLHTQLAQIPGSLRALYRQPRALRVGARYLGTLLKVHPKESHWYLMLLATDPERQRTGAGTLLMNDGLSRVDAEGVGGYLETQKEENLAYYRRFGFDLKETLHPMTDGPPYYTMWRPPR
jgi:ribosomal protein S18 acetylase RimI-like enzyme